MSRSGMTRQNLASDRVPSQESRTAHFQSSDYTDSSSFISRLACVLVQRDQSLRSPIFRTCRRCQEVPMRRFNLPSAGPYVSDGLIPLTLFRSSSTFWLQGSPLELMG